MSESPLLPLEDAREAALFFVVSALCFLAALTALGAKSTYSAAQNWTAQIEGEMTIRLRDTDRRGAEEARTLIGNIPGVETAQILTVEEMHALLAPQLGGSVPESIRLPLIIAIETAPGFPNLVETMETRLNDAGFSASVNDHAAWSGDVRRSLSLIRNVAFLTIALLSATAISVIAFATHAALLARKDIVDVLHLSGAHDRFIARLFQKRFWGLGLRAGAVGAVAALGGVALTLWIVRGQSETSGLLPQLALDGWDVAILLLTPFIAGLAARYAARLTVLTALKQVN